MFERVYFSARVGSASVRSVTQVNKSEENSERVDEYYV